MFLNEVRVHKTVSRATFNESTSRNRRLSNRKNKRNRQGIRTGKSGRVESETLWCTDEFNVTPGLCRVTRAALYFSDLLAGPEVVGWDAVLALRPAAASARRPLAFLLASFFLQLSTV